MCDTRQERPMTTASQVLSTTGAEAARALKIIESMPGFAWSADAAGRLTYVSSNILAPTGSASEDWGRIVHPDDYDRVATRWRHCLQTGDDYDIEHRLRRADGVYQWFRTSGRPARDSQARITEWHGTTIDIEEQKRAETALRQSERQLQQLVDAVPAAIWCTAPDGTPTYRNKRHNDITGVTLKDLSAPDGKLVPLAVLAHPDDRAAAQQVRARAFETGSSYVVRYRQLRSDGTYRWTESRAEPLRDDSGNILQWYGVSVDIHDVATAQEAVRDRERELVQLVDMVPSLLWRLTPEGEPVFFSKRTIDFLGLDVADFDKPGISRLEAVMETVHPDDAAEVGNTLHRCLATGESFAMRYRLRRADGVYRWMQGRAEPMRDRDGRILQWYGLCHDIDDQMHAEDVLRRSEQQLRRLVDALPTQIWAATSEGEPSYLNKRLADYVGLTLSDLDTPDASRLQNAIQSSVHPDDAPAVGRALLHSFTSGDTFAMKYRQRRADGVYRWINGRAEPLRDPTGRILEWYGVSFDIDDEVRTQEELRWTQERLAVSSQAASLAELSASIAHEVNQPLAAIVFNSHACYRWLSTEPPNVERAKVTAERITRDANSAADVVSRIRALFRQSGEPRELTLLSGVIAEACNLHGAGFA
jgi:PAS domain S-box-containing protein